MLPSKSTNRRNDLSLPTLTAAAGFIAGMILMHAYDREFQAVKIIRQKCSCERFAEKGYRDCCERCGCGE